MWGIVWTDIASVGFVVVLAFAQRQMSRPGHRRASCSAEDNSDLSGTSRLLHCANMCSIE